MENIVQRVRGVMNLLLVWTLVLFWVATVKPVDIHRLCYNLEIKSNKLLGAARNGGVVCAISLGGPKGPPLTDAESDLLNRFAKQLNVQSKLRYSSLHVTGEPEPHATALEYLDACQRTIDTALEGAQAKHPGLRSPETQALLVELQRHVAELGWHIGRLELGPTATLFDVAIEARPRIEIPGTGQSIPMAGGVAMSIIGLACVYFYLVSLLRALRESLVEQEAAIGRELVFLHPGWLGLLLAFVWLTSPLVALYDAGELIFSHQAVDSVYSLPGYTVFALPAAWAWSVIAALRTRRAAYRVARQEADYFHSTAEQRLATLTHSGDPLSRRRAA